METSKKKSRESLHEASVVSNFKENPAENWRLNWLYDSINRVYNSAYVIIYLFRSRDLQIMIPMSMIPPNSKIIFQLL